jgi:lysophospholipase L1-like esterase
VSASDRSWTIAPTLLWFAGCLVVALCVLDGGVRAVADRFTVRRASEAAPAVGPAFTARPAGVAEAKDDDDRPAKPLPIVASDRSKILALEDLCVDGTPDKCKRWAMDGFYRAVGDAKQGKLGRAVRVSWYGDSVIATDAIPSRLRGKLQASYGDGGPGFVYLVAPHKFCHHEQVEKTQSGWLPYGISTSAVSDKMYGAGGSTAESFGGTAKLSLKTGAQSAELYYLTQPKGGTLTLNSGGSELLKVETAGDAKAPGYATAKVAGAKKLEFEAKGKVRTFGVALENPAGIVVDNFGIVSVNVKSFSNHDPAFFTGELAHRKADLLMIMIGANEAAWLGPGDRDTKDYAGRYESVLKLLRKGRPDGSCLVVSPTDQAEAKDGSYPSRPVMPVLVEAQRKAAAAAGCAFFSTYDWMGGKGSASKWFSKRYVGSDFQHLTVAGAAKMGDALYDALTNGFGRYAGP